MHKVIKFSGKLLKATISKDMAQAFKLDIKSQSVASAIIVGNTKAAIAADTAFKAQHQKRNGSFFGSPTRLSINLGLGQSIAKSLGFELTVATMPKLLHALNNTMVNGEWSGKLIGDSFTYQNGTSGVITKNHAQVNLNVDASDKLMDFIQVSENANAYAERKANADKAFAAIFGNEGNEGNEGDEGDEGGTPERPALDILEDMTKAELKALVKEHDLSIEGTVDFTKVALAFNYSTEEISALAE